MERAVSVPILVVPSQCDNLIIGANVIRFLMHQLKITSDYWCLGSSGNLLPECEQFLNLMANSSRWRGEELPDRIRTVKLQQTIFPNMPWTAVRQKILCIASGSLMRVRSA